VCTLTQGMASECLGAPVYVFSVLKFKADEGSWLPGEPDEVSIYPTHTHTYRG